MRLDHGKESDHGLDRAQPGREPRQRLLRCYAGTGAPGVPGRSQRGRRPSASARRQLIGRNQSNRGCAVRVPCSLLQAIAWKDAHPDAVGSMRIDSSGSPRER
jgi:hypothetical protein